MTTSQTRPPSANRIAAAALAAFGAASAIPIPFALASAFLAATGAPSVRTVLLAAARAP